MKKISILALLFATYSNIVSAQTPPPVLSGLIQHLDAAVGFTPGDLPDVYNSAQPIPCGTPIYTPRLTSTPSYALWSDISGKGNHVQTGGVQTWCDCSGIGCPVSAPILTNANPQYISNANGSGFPAIYFDNNDYMETIPGVFAPINSGGMSPANGLFSTDNVTEATIFCVRTARSGIQSIAGNDNTYSMVNLTNIDPAQFTGSGALPPKPGIPEMRDEFSLMRDWAANVTTIYHGPVTTGNNYFNYKDHQCFNQTPSNRPVVLCGSYGTNFNNLDYYVNGIQSTNSLQVYPSGYSTNHTNASRLITIGTRPSCVSTNFKGIGYTDFFEGYIFEILVYNRKLTQAEIDATNEYLLCKYDVNYTACNNYPTTCPKGCYFSPLFTISHLGHCQFQATASGTPRPGVTILGYEWDVPGVGVFISSSNTQTFSLSSMFSGQITVKVLGVNLGMNDDNPTMPICCEYVMTKKITCENGAWTESKNASTISEALAESASDQVMIFPNPTKGDIYIKNPEDKEMNVSVMDLTGKKIATSKAGKGVTKMSIGENAAAMYMVIITDQLGNVVKSARLVLDK